MPLIVHVVLTSLTYDASRAHVPARPLPPTPRWHVSFTFDPLHGGLRLRAARRRPEPSTISDQPCACTLVQEHTHQRILQQLKDLVCRNAHSLAAALTAVGEPPTDTTLVRWLTACKWDADHAHTLLQQHVQWRASFGKPFCEDAIADELAAHKVCLQPGTDAAGHAVLVVLARNHNGAARDLSQTTRLIVYALDAAIAACDPVANPLQQIVCLFDLSGLSLNNLDVGGLRAVFETLQQHYPERLAALYFINAPLIFWGLWKLVSPLVDGATRAKLRFLSHSALADTLPADVLPAAYGGTAALVPVDEAVAQRRGGSGPAPRWRRGLGRVGQASGAPLRGLGQLLRRVPGMQHAPAKPPRLLLRAASLQVVATLQPLLVRVLALARRVLQWTFGAV